MALSERKDVVKKMKGNPFSSPDPVRIYPIVLSYLFDFTRIVEEVEDINKVFRDVIPKSSIKSANEIKPLQGYSIFKKIQDVEFKYTYESYLRAFSAKKDPLIPLDIFDKCLGRINHLPLKTQIDFLDSLHDENREIKDEDYVLKRARMEIKAIFKDTNLFESKQDLFNNIKDHILEITMKKIINHIFNEYQDPIETNLLKQAINFILNPFQNTNTKFLKEDPYTDLQIKHIDYLLKSPRVQSGKRLVIWSKNLPLLAILLILGILYSFDSNHIVRRLQTVPLLLLILVTTTMFNKALEEKSFQTPEEFLINARERLTQIQNGNTVTGSEEKASLKPLVIHNKKANEEESLRFRRP